MRNRLEALTNVVVIVACMAVTAGVAADYLVKKEARRPPATFERGRTLATSSDLELDAAENTLIMIVRSTCGFCTASMPFYRTLAEGRRAGTIAARLVVVSSEDEGTSTAYLKRNGVSVDKVVRLRNGPLTRSPTPHLILVDRAAKIEGSRSAGCAT